MKEEKQSAQSRVTDGLTISHLQEKMPELTRALTTEHISEAIAAITPVQGQIPTSQPVNTTVTQPAVEEK